MEPTTQITIAIGVLVLLLCLRRRRTGRDELPTSNAEHRTSKEEDVETMRARDEAFIQFQDHSHE
jgi:hypothetical protein